jgi:hypothetical protein
MTQCRILPKIDGVGHGMAFVNHILAKKANFHYFMVKINTCI